MSADFQHTPVLLKQSIELLNIRPKGTYVDCTLGGGGHTLEILKLLGPDGQVLGIDQDKTAIEAAKIRLSKYHNISFIKDNFRNIKKILTDPVDGILLDLGVSSHQIDTAERGFSIRENGPLDMRMDTGSRLTAEAVINQYGESELVRIFSEFGEERFSKRIARAIVKQRETNPFRTTAELKAAVEAAIPTWKKRESVTRIFQSLRIAVNEELFSLEQVLADSIDLLNSGGRIVVIAYHSLEDRLVKQALRQAKADKRLKVLTKKPLTASEEEIASNPRARSAKLRAGERL